MKKLALIFFLSIKISASIYYVDATNGNDNNDGLAEATAWKTIAKVNKSSFQPGDEILFKRGEEWREQLTIPSSGEELNPIIFGTYGSGNKPIINGADLIVSGWEVHTGFVWKVALTNEPKIVLFNNALGVEALSLGAVNSNNKWFWEDKVLYIYSNLEPTNVEAGARKYAIFDSDDKYFVIDGFEVKGTNTHGLGFVGNNPNAFVEVKNCYIHHTRLVGVLFNSGYGNSLVEDSRAEYTGSGFYVSPHSNNNTFRRDTAEHNIRYLVGVNTRGRFADGHGFGIEEADRCIIEYSSATDNDGNFAVDLNHHPGYGATIRYNKSYNSKHKNYGYNISRLGTGTTNVYYNLSVNDGAGYANAFWNEGDNLGLLKIYNNTFYNGGNIAATTVRFYNNSDNVVFKNNLIYNLYSSNSGFQAISTTNLRGLDADFNLYYTPNLGHPFRAGSNTIENKYTNLVEWQTITGQDTKSILDNPYFIDENTFSLDENSPAIDAGKDVGLSQDIKGNPIIGSPDIGAYEFQPITENEITIEGNTGLGNTILEWINGTNKTIQSDPEGDFSITVQHSWSGTITPSKSGYTFDPEVREYSNIASNYTNQDFSAAPQVFSIEGNTGLGNVTLEWIDGTNKTIQSDQEGNFKITVPYNWGGTITPSKSGFTFDPEIREYSNATSNYTNQNFMASPQVFSIEGNTGVGKVTLEWIDGTNKTIQSDPEGKFEITVPYNWSGTITPSKSGYTFNPEIREYQNISNNFANQDFDILKNEVSLIVKIQLSGTYNIEPSPDNFSIPQNQPYNSEPWNYSGNEELQTNLTGIIDWVLVEIRPDSTSYSSRKAALLKSNGFIYNIESDSVLTFPEIPSGNYYITLYHRNHLPVMSAQRLNLGPVPEIYDFTSSISKAFGENSMTKLPDGRFGLISGDGNMDGIVNEIDYENVADNIFKTGYLYEDLDMNGIINVLDYSQVFQNNHKSSNVPEIINFQEIRRVVAGD